MSIEEKLLEKLIQDYPGDAIAIIENLESPEIAVLLEAIPVELSAILLSQMDRYKAARCLEKVELKIVIGIMEKFSTPLAEALLRQIDKNMQAYVLGGLPPEASIPLARMLEYSKNSVGAHIDPMVFTLHDDLLAEQGLEKMRRTKLPILSHIYILNRNHKLIGYIGLQELISVDQNTGILSIMKGISYQVPADMEVSALLENWNDDELANYLPVVDKNKHFLGIITKKNLTRIRRLKPTINRRTIQAGVALGELYQIGLAGLFTSIRVPGNQNNK